MNTPRTTLTLMASLLALPALAQSSTDLVAAQTRYRQEIAQCSANTPAVPDTSCMKEARNTLAEIRRGKMPEVWQASDFIRNAQARCDVHQGDDKTDCLARMQGLGKVEGSVAGGGILRELTTTSVVPVAPPAAPPTKPPAAERPSGLMSNCRWVPPTDWVCH